jgi:adenosylmethionine-8-amino-7-oxononanoate aminotransferase
VRADLTTFAKGVTSGYVPLGGVLLAPSVHEPLAADPAFVLRHGYTYSGHATACAAALACIDLTEREGLLDRATAIGEHLGAGLRTLHHDGLVADVRGAGAVWAVSVQAGTDPVAVRDRALDAGVVVRPIAPATHRDVPAARDHRRAARRGRRRAPDGARLTQATVRMSFSFTNSRMP